MLRDMFKKTYTMIDTKRISGERPAEKGGEASPAVPAGLWRKCNKCGRPIYVEDVRNNYYICPKCGGYFRVHAYRRIEITADEGTFEEWDKEMPVSNPLSFPGYEKKLAAAQEKTKLNEAIVTGKCSIGGCETVIGVCDARFLMSSMGHNVGEKITRAVERATKEKLPVILFACSGGARMQEGMVSLMQMAKTAAALKRHHEAGQLFISVLTDPTTGGVTASFAMLGDIILAEPGALIGFAGPRVIEQTIGQKLPEGFQRSEFLLEHGFVDKIVKREEMKETLAHLLRLHENRTDASSTEASEAWEQEEPFKEKQNVRHTRANALGSLSSLSSAGALIRSAWDSVLLSRKSDRPVATDYIDALFDGFVELHGILFKIRTGKSDLRRRNDPDSSGLCRGSRKRGQADADSHASLDYRTNRLQFSNYKWSQSCLLSLHAALSLLLKPAEPFIPLLSQLVFIHRTPCL